MLALSSCAATLPAQTTSRSPSPSMSATPSASAIPASHDLFAPGLAQQVVSELVTAAAGKPVVRVVINRTQARLTYIGDGDRPRSMVWLAGVITPSDDGTDLVAATSFDPNTFNLSDVASLFTIAAQVSGSAERQELQINEYDHRQILMTVTTSPESSTVFFDRDGNPIPRLDLTVDKDLAIGLNDVYYHRRFVLTVSVTVDSADVMSSADQVWVDVLDTPGVVERRIRTATVPMFITRHRETPSTLPFDQTVIDPAVIGQLIRTAPLLLEQPDVTTVTVTVNQPADADQPRITVESGGSKVVTDLMGNKIENP